MVEGEGREMDYEEGGRVVLPDFRSTWPNHASRIMDQPEVDPLTMFYEKIQDLVREKEALLSKFGRFKQTLQDAMGVLDVQAYGNETTQPGEMGPPPPVADSKKKSGGDLVGLRIQIGELEGKLEIQGKMIGDLIEDMGKVHEKLDAVILGSRMSAGGVESPNVPSSSSAIDPFPIPADSNNIDQLVEDERDEDLDKEAVELRTGSSAITEMDTIIDEQTAMNVVRAMVLGKAHRKLGESIIGSRMAAMEVEFPNIPRTSPSINVSSVSAGGTNTNMDQVIEDGRDEAVDYEALEGRSDSSGETEMGTIIDELTARKAVRALILPKAVLGSSGAINGASISARSNAMSQRIEDGQDAKDLENEVIEGRAESMTSSGMDIINKLRVMNLPRNRWRQKRTRYHSYC